MPDDFGLQESDDLERQHASVRVHEHVPSIR